MSCYRGVSRALSVLLGFQSEIKAFLAPTDECNLVQASWWLYQLAKRTRRSQHAAWPTDGELHALTQRLHARLARSGGRGDVRNRRTKMRLSAGQVRVLLRDLLLVASGLRVSCLVDCCAMTKELAELLLDAIADDNGPYQSWFIENQVRAVLLDGNVFFVNVDAFVREKMVELATGMDQQMYMDVSASLAQPQLINNNSEAGVSRLTAFADWIAIACKELLTPTSSRVQEWKRPSRLNSTALAGILLCYPCVYDILADGNEADADEWSEQENCLSMCPLYLVQTAALMPSEQMEIALQEFSVPQHLLNNCSSFNNEQHQQEEEEDAETNHAVDSPLAKMLQTCCQLRLKRAIPRSLVVSANIKPLVLVGARTLHRVAL